MFDKSSPASAASTISSGGSSSSSALGASAVAMVSLANGDCSSKSKNDNNDSTEQEFEDIINQLNALNDTIDQELFQTNNKVVSYPSPTTATTTTKTTKQSFNQTADNLDSLSTTTTKTNSQQPAPPNPVCNQAECLINGSGSNYSSSPLSSPNKSMASTQSNNYNNNPHHHHHSPPSSTMVNDYHIQHNNHHAHHSSTSSSSSSPYHSAIANNNVVGQTDGIQQQQQPQQQYFHPSNISTTAPPPSSSNMTTATTITNNVGVSCFEQQPTTAANKSQIAPASAIVGNQQQSNPFVHHPMHHYHHHHHHHAVYPHDSVTPPVLNGENPDHESIIGLSTSLTMSSQTRTDSPDNDSAFSDSISLISSEQSSSSSTNGKSRKGNNSGQSSQSVNSSGSSSSCEDSGINQSSSTSSSNPAITATSITKSSNQLVIQGDDDQDVSGDNSGSVQQNPQQQQQQQQQLFFEQNEKQQDDDSFTEQESQTLTRKNNHNQSSLLSNEDHERFELIAHILSDIDWRLEGVLDQDSIPNDEDVTVTETHLENKIPDDNNHDDDRVVVVDGGGHNHDSHRSRLTINGQQQQQQLKDDYDLAHKNNINAVADQDLEDKDEIIQKALEKIREANIRKLYLKVFAEDDSTKCLLADERMTVGHICQQMAQKNHIALGMNYCIMEQMPQLYLERFYEDHELLVENVLYWGRDHANKIYFVQQPDKYDMFVQPEKYLISVSQPNENVDTLKSGSLRARYNANQLRSDLIAQFFVHVGNAGQVRVPEIEGNLYLRSEGKKVWKKYFFSLRSSGLYYCPKGKPKSTKDLICLTTFELNCVYYGIGWKKKFKAPNDFGFAIKHPQIQTKSPKHIKYLCAENQDDLKLWLTGIRIAKYGRRLLDNYEQFKMNDLNNTEPDTIDAALPANKKITTFPLNHGSANDLQNENYAYGDESHYDHLHRSGSITMRANRVPRNDSVRSSSASSSSGCMSEQSSVVSTPSSSGSGSTTIIGHDPSNYHHHNHNPHSVTASPHHHPMHPVANQNQLNAFDADFPIGTIKRKPNVMIQPKIPLTNTTRNLALQSDDALLEVNDASTGSCGAGVGDEDSACCMNAMASPHHHHHLNGLSPSNTEQFQRGSFKSGTLRRTQNGDVAKSKMLPAMLSPQHHGQQIYSTTNALIKTNGEINHNHQHLDDDLPPPPPPPPTSSLKEAESTLSLNASFPPPPPPEVLNSPSPQPPNSLSMSNISRQSDSQQQKSPSVESPIKSPPSLSALPLPPMTPQPQIKNRLTRRLSDLSENATYFMNFRSNYDGAHPNTFERQPQPGQEIYAPQSRASIATSSDSTSFVTLKSNLMKLNKFTRHNSVDHYHHSSQQSAWNKYGTSPRLRPIDHQQPMNGCVGNPVVDSHQFYPRQHPAGANYAAYGPTATTINGQVSHCAIVSDMPGPRTEYDIPPTRVKVFANYPQQSSAPPRFGPPPPPIPPSAMLETSTNNSHYGSYPNSPAHQPHNLQQQQQQPRENHYMSISPHLLQKHQQMVQQQQQQQQQNQQNNCCSPNSNGIYSGNVPYHVPEEIFLKNMERVMKKKWHVAQMLEQDVMATPGQVLGFRDSAYLPPPSPSTDNHMSNYPLAASAAPPPPPLPPHQTQSQYATYNGQYNGQSPSHYPSPIPMMESQSPYRSLPYYHSNGNGGLGKSVQFSDSNPMIINDTPPLTPTHQSNYGTGGCLRKVPPPPPKRSESTQLTTGTNCSTSRR